MAVLKSSGLFFFFFFEEAVGSHTVIIEYENDPMKLNLQLLYKGFTNILYIIHTAEYLSVFTWA